MILQNKLSNENPFFTCGIFTKSFLIIILLFQSFLNFCWHICLISVTGAESDKSSILLLRLLKEDGTFVWVFHTILIHDSTLETFYQSIMWKILSFSPGLEKCLILRIPVYFPRDKCAYTFVSRETTNEINQISKLISFPHLIRQRF